jgi:hypothetical protein
MTSLELRAQEFCDAAAAAIQDLLHPRHGSKSTAVSVVLVELL